MVRRPTRWAWMIVGPPDFAPAIGNVVSMYDTIWDVVVRHPQIPIPNLAIYRTGGALEPLTRQRDDWDAAASRFRTLRPSYNRDIVAVLQRAAAAMFVHHPPDVLAAFHNPIGPHVWEDLGDPNPVKDVLRQPVFARLRDPESKE